MRALAILVLLAGCSASPRPVHVRMAVEGEVPPPWPPKRRWGPESRVLRDLRLGPSCPTVGVPAPWFRDAVVAYARQHFAWSTSKIRADVRTRFGMLYVYAPRGGGDSYCLVVHEAIPPTIIIHKVGAWTVR